MGLFREETREIANKNSLYIMRQPKWSLGEYNNSDNTKPGLVNAWRIEAVIKARVGHT